MSEALFITQQKLEEWIEEGEVLFEDNTLTIFAENVSYELEPAIRILRVLDGADVHGWVGRVLCLSEAQGQGAEHYRDSLVCGETAYECEEGYVGKPGEAAAASGSAAEPSEAVAASTPEPAAPMPASDTDLLADFLLKHM